MFRYFDVLLSCYDDASLLCSFATTDISSPLVDDGLHVVPDGERGGRNEREEAAKDGDEPQGAVGILHGNGFC
jgi:hypothetical protein